MAKTICQIQHTHTKIETEKLVTRKALYQLMNNVVYGKTMENLRNRIDANCATKKKKDYLKWTSKP